MWRGGAGGLKDDAASDFDGVVSAALITAGLHLVSANLEAKRNS